MAIPTGIISAGFVEQYTKMKPLDEVSQESDILFFNFDIEEDHPYALKRIMDIPLPPEVVIVAVIRDENVVVPRGNTQIRPGDEVIMGALEYKNHHAIKAREFMIDKAHPWNGEYIWNLEIPEDMVIVSIIRHGKVIIPKGQIEFQPGDLVTVCEHQSETE